MSTKQRKQNKAHGKRTEKRFAFFRPSEFKFWLAIAIAITFVFFVSNARSGTFFGLTLKVNTDLENGLVGHWTFDGKDTVGTTTVDRINGNDGAITGPLTESETVEFITSGTTWTVPADWNSTSNSIEVIGGGGGGASYSSNTGWAGGGGGAYSKALNQTLSPGSTVTIAVGSGGGPGTAGGDTYLCNSTTNCASIGGTAVLVGAKGGNGASSQTGGAGGSTASGVGSVKYAGGTGGNAGNYAGAGGGGAGGPSAAGAAGGTQGNQGGGGGGGANGGSVGSNGGTNNGGAGGDGPNASGGGVGGTFGVDGADGSDGGGGGGGYGSSGDGVTNTNAGTGGSGTEFDATHGSGGGGGGAGDSSSAKTAGDGGLYGGGGGGAAADSGGVGGSGGAGVIVVTNNPTRSQLLSVPGRLSSALSFDGTDDYVDIGATGQTVKTVAFWIKADTLTEDILDLNGTADVTVSAGTISANSFTSPTIYVDGEVSSTLTTGWHHVIITTTAGISASNMDIGRANGTYFAGALDDVRIYNRVLSVTEITRLAELGMTTKLSTTISSNPELESGLLGHWTLDGKDTSNATATDRIAGNDGSISGNEIVATTTYTTSYVIDAQEVQPQDITFNNDGTKMYISGNNGNDITSYSLSVPYDLSSTVTHITQHSIATEIANPTGVVFNNNGTKMFVTGYLADAVFEYTLSSAYDLASTVTFVASTSVVINNNGPSGLAFNEDGSKLFVINSIDDYVGEYAMSIPFTVSSMSYTTKYYLGGQETEPSGIVFNHGGTKMFILGKANDKIHEYTLSSSFDLSSTITHIDEFSILAQDGQMGGLEMNSAGTKLFTVADNTANTVYEYALTEGFDLGGNIDTSLSTQGRLGAAMDFDGIDDYIDISGVAGSINESAGTFAAWVYLDDAAFAGGLLKTIMSVGDASSDLDYISLRITTGDEIRFRYVDSGVVTNATSLNTPAYNNQWVHITGTWDGTNTYLYFNGELEDGPNSMSGTIADATLDQGAIGAETSTDFDLFFDGKIDDVRIYDRALPADQIKRLAQLGMTTHIGVTPKENPNTQSSLIGHWTFDGKDTTLATSTDIAGSNDGTINGSSQEVNVTATVADSYSVTSQETNPTGLAFNADGTKMFTVGFNSKYVYEYTLSVAYDLSSTVTYIDSYYVGGYISSPTGLSFNTDGTKMFVTGTGGDEINVFTLGTGFDISSASYSTVKSLSGQDSSVQDHTWNNDGTKLFMVGLTGKDINEYTLSTGFDVDSTFTFIDSYSVSGQEANPTTMAFNDDGTKMYVIGYTNNTIFEYSLSTGFDVSTASYTGNSLDSTGAGNSPYGLRFVDSGYSMFTIANGPDTVYKYFLDHPYDVAGTTTDNISLATPGKVGSALSFDGVNDYVDISGVAAGVDETQGSIAAWVYVPSSQLDGTAGSIIDVGDASSGANFISLRTTNSNSFALRYRVGGVDYYSYATPLVDQWQHVVVTWDTDNAQYVYLNGAQTDTDSRGADISGGLLDQATIGADAGNSVDLFFDGKIDDVRIYSKALSALEVKRLYETGT